MSCTTINSLDFYKQRMQGYPRDPMAQGALGGGSARAALTFTALRMVGFCCGRLREGFDRSKMVGSTRKSGSELRRNG